MWHKSVVLATLWALAVSSALSVVADVEDNRLAALQPTRDLKYVHLNADGDLDVAYPANLDSPTFVTDPGPTTVLHVVRNIHTDPMPHVVVRVQDAGLEYEYVIENGQAALQAIDRWYLILETPDFVGERREPLGWFHVPRAIPTPSDPRASYYLRPQGYFAEWLVRNGPSGKGPAPIHAGESGTFTLRSDACPGFVRSFFTSGFQEDPTGDMPGSVADELRPFLTMEGGMRARTVLGPAFAKSRSAGEIASTLRQSVSSMIAAKELAADSMLVREAVDALDRLARGRDMAAPIQFRSEPNSELERQLRIAVESDCAVKR
jgi:hypothetical protein